MSEDQIIQNHDQAPDQQAGDPPSLPPVWLMALALVAVAANLRVAIASVPPLTRIIASDLGLSNAWIGALTTLPVLCMGLMAPAAQRLGARLGAATSVQVAMVAVFAGVLLRWQGDHLWALYGGTFAAGFGIAVAGTLLPRLVKAVFPPERTGTVTGLYMLAMMGGATAASALSVPLAARWGSWQGSLATWSILAALGVLVWAPVTVRISKYKAANPVAATSHSLPWRYPTAWLIATYLAVQSWQFYSSLAWIAPSFVARGWDPTTAGYLLSAFSGAQLVSGLLGPILTDRVHDHRTLLVPAACLGLLGMLALFLTSHAASGAADHTAFAWAAVCVLGLGQGAAFSLALVLLVDYAQTPSGSGRLTAMAFFVSYTIASFGPTVMGALRDLTGSFDVIWLSMAALTLVQAALATQMKPSLAKVP
ncbi:MAG: transporter, family, cyanate transporter [Actinomycetota bacterium]|nr:transporter, family, cyanate transporter [Actinomycetota bacterium]